MPRRKNKPNSSKRITSWECVRRIEDYIAENANEAVQLRLLDELHSAGALLPHPDDGSVSFGDYRSNSPMRVLLNYIDVLLLYIEDDLENNPNESDN